jgi:carbon monoxide dehydrogenase subunit G
MTETSPDSYKVEMQLRVAAVGGTFEGAVSLSDKDEPKSCNIQVSGSGSIGHGTGTARFDIEPDGNGAKLIYKGNGEIGGLVAGVGQRILSSVSKHLIGRFFVALRKEFEAENKAAG